MRPEPAAKREFYRRRRIVHTVAGAVWLCMVYAVYHLGIVASGIPGVVTSDGSSNRLEITDFYGARKRVLYVRFLRGDGRTFPLVVDPWEVDRFRTGDELLLERVFEIGRYRPLRAPFDYHYRCYLWLRWKLRG